MSSLPRFIPCPGCCRLIAPENFHRSRNRQPYGLALRCKQCERRRRAVRQGFETAAIFIRRPK